MILVQGTVTGLLQPSAANRAACDPVPSVLMRFRSLCPSRSSRNNSHRLSLSRGQRKKYKEMFQ